MYGCEASNVEDTIDSPIVTQPSIEESNEDFNIPEDILGTRPPIYQRMALENPNAVSNHSLRDYWVSIHNFGRYSMDSLLSDEEIEFFAEPNEDVLVNINLSNPDGQAILRITLNNEIYQSFQFQEGSDSETIVIEFNSGSESGISDITIDEIKYVENNTNLIKDALFEGERTIHFGVSHVDLPDVDIVELDVDSNQALIDLVFIDPDELIDSEVQPTALRLFEGDIEVKTYELTPGEHQISLEDLKFNSTYTYKVTSNYDRIDGLGSREVTLTEGEFNTAQILNIRDLIPTHESIEFTKELQENDLNISFKAINIYLDEKLVETSNDPKQNIFNNLLSDSNYQLKVLYEYELLDEIIEMSVSESFKTLALTKPAISNREITIFQTSINFNFELMDPAQIGEVTTVQILHNQEIIQTLDDVFERSFKNLNANQEYTLKIILSYDLNDGQGLQNILYQENFKTTSFQLPNIDITALNPLREGAEIALNIDDPDGIGSPIKIEVFNDDNLVSFINEDQINLSNYLELNMEELNQYNGTEGQLSYIAVSGVIYDVTNTPYWVNGVFIEDSNLSAGYDLTEEIKALMENGTEVLVEASIVGVLKGNVLQTISNLQSNQDYLVKVTYEYNLKEGAGPQVIVVEETFQTISSRTPSVHVSSSSIAETKYNFTVTITDEDNLGQLKEIEVYQNNMLVQTLFDVSERSVDNLLADTNYTLKVIYEYDLNEGGGVETIIKNQPFKTHAYDLPVVSFGAISIRQSSIDWTINLDDSNQLIESYRVELWLESDRVSQTENQLSGTFDELFSGIDYQLKIIYQYDRQDGNDVITDQLENQVATLQKPIPIVSLAETQVSSGGISFTAQLSDPSLIGTLSAIRLKQGGNIVDDFAQGAEVIFNDLLSDTQYTIEIDISYQFNAFEDVLKRTQTFTLQTLALNTPKITIEHVTPQKTSIALDLNIEDPDATGSLEKIELYEGISPVAVFNDLDAFNDFELNPSTTYRLNFVYAYDLNDGTGLKTVSHEFTVKTLLMNGTGTLEDPYQIENEVDLSNIRESLSSYYILMNDIYITQENWNPIGSHPRNHFAGHFDGKDYSIYGLNINQSYEDEHITFGLFRTILDGTVKNLVISNASINISLTTTDHINPKVAILAGQIFSSNIDNIHVLGDITFNATGGLIHHISPNIGGLIGSLHRSSVDRVSADVNIDAYVRGTAYSHLNVGGILGLQHSSTLENAYATGVITGHAAGATARVGGIVGHSYSVIKNAYADVIVTAEVSISHSNSWAVGGLILGVGDYNGYIFDSLGLGEVHIKTAPENSIGASQGLFGGNWGSTENSYYASTTITTRNGEAYSINPKWEIDINEISSDWFIDDLNFDSEIWDLENFDFSEEITLK